MKFTRSTTKNLALFAGLIAVYFGLNSYFVKPPEKKNYVLAEAIGEIVLSPLNSVAESHYTNEEVVGLNKKLLQGKVTFVNFWASWCTACDKEEEYLQAIWQDYQGKPINIIGIASHDDKEKAQESHKMKSRKYAHFLDEKGEVSRNLGITSLPQSAVFDGSGQLRYRIKLPVDEYSFYELRAVLNGLLKEQKLGVDGIATSYNKPATQTSDQYTDYLPIFGWLPDFNLTASDGGGVKKDTLRGYVWVANFIFSNCDSMCPLLTQEMKNLHRNFGDNNRFATISITVDPKNDTPERLSEYRQEQNLDGLNWKFLTGDWSSIKQLMTHGFRVGVPDEPVFHTEKFVLIDQQLRIRGYYSAQSAHSLGQLNADIQSLLSIDDKMNLGRR